MSSPRSLPKCMFGKANLEAEIKRKDSLKQLSTKVCAIKMAHLKPIGIVAWHTWRCKSAVFPGRIVRSAMRRWVSSCRCDNATAFIGRRPASQMGRVMLWNIFDMSSKKAPGSEPRMRIASNIAGFGNDV